MCLSASLHGHVTASQAREESSVHASWRFSNVLTALRERITRGSAAMPASASSSSSSASRGDAPSLLLLPCPPSPATPDTVRAAYRGTLLSVISRISDEHRRACAARSVAPVVVVAVVLDILTAPSSTTRCRSVLWNKAQAVLAEVYSVITLICAEKSIASDLGAEEPGAVDARVVLVHHDRSAVEAYKPNSDGVYEANNTAVLDMAAFASSVHPWKRIFHPTSEPGYELLTTYLRYAEGKQKLLHQQLIAVEGGLSLSKPAPAPTANPVVESSEEQSTLALKTYTTVCVGGTFDHLHAGHKLLLHAALLILTPGQAAAAAASLREGQHQGELVVGISSDELLVKKQYREELQSWEFRARAVLDFFSTLLDSCTTAQVATRNVEGETEELHAEFRQGTILVRCVDFHDVYGPTVKEQGMQALVVSAETRSGGAAVNKKRQSQGWSQLDVYEIRVLDAHVDDAPVVADDFAAKISSTEIRKHKAERRRQMADGAQRV